MAESAAGPSITAADVLAEAERRHGQENVTARELADTYEAMHSAEQRKKGGVYYTPQPVVEFVARFALDQGFQQIGPEAADVLRIVACDPSCGAGVFLVEAAERLSVQYAGRLIGSDPPMELVNAVMPAVILTCVFGIDIDPVSAELARIGLSLATGGVLPAEALTRHVIAGDPLAGDSPPALEERRTAAEVADVS